MSCRYTIFRNCFGPMLVVAGLTVTPGILRGDPEPKPAAPAAEASQADVKSREKVVKTDAEWRKQLSKTQFRVTRQKWTEPAFSGAYWKSHKDGIYQCVCCEQALFDSHTKFESGTGWPSFWQPLEKEAVSYQPDRSEGQLRMEVLCSRCDAHLGHVFTDGPPPTGARFCMNSAALKLVDRKKSSAE